MLPNWRLRKSTQCMNRSGRGSVKMSKTKNSGRRDNDLPMAQKRELYQRAACMCEFANCGIPLFFDLRSGLPVNNGDFAHIIPSSANGPRGAEDAGNYEIDSPENRILLCKKHHKLVDENECNYPAVLLRRMKRQHEDKVRGFQSIINSEASLACILTAKIKGVHEVVVSDSSVNEAVVARGHPLADSFPQRINLVSDRTYGTKAYWQSMVLQLEGHVERMVSLIKSRGDAGLGLSIFPLAPIPLIAKFASLIGDKIPFEVFPRLRNAHLWMWRTDSKLNKFSCKRIRVGSRVGRVALVISATAPILKQFLSEVNYKGDIYHIHSQRMGLDPVKSLEDLASFRSAFHEALGDIQQTHGSSVKVDVFPCVPNTVAFEIGCRRMAKVHPEMIVYENCCGWKPAVVIGGGNDR